ncbi:PTS sugar transporter subunit IIA [Kiritimatiella glycovorans]|uniref:PTS system sugar transporter subunit IIA n=1 Tax=Kiritimatiella glycovorans TaxID=1307763 RepID=A0A0G3EH91_9BACT|nr:PTS sugar transporter subunit IIA [Kiritimatiella glycovorans]AKJ63514.1 PTS system sugar transporter subunit IIA [Kiritimatiella glycovorans]
MTRLAQAMKPECCRAGAHPGDRDAALRLVAQAAKASPVLHRIGEDEIYRLLREREELQPTTVDSGRAIPHCRIRDISDFVAGVITVPDGVDFGGGKDDSPVRLMVFIIAPEERSNEHIKLLSAVSRALLAEPALERCLEAGDEAALRETFISMAPGRGETAASGAQNMFHIFIETEEVFDRVMEVLAGMENCSVTVIDVKSAQQYLTRIPIFAAFSGDVEMENLRCIIAVGDRKLSNEVIRSVDEACGGLGPDCGVLLTVQEIAYTGGSLSA